VRTLENQTPPYPKPIVSSCSRLRWRTFLLITMNTPMFRYIKHRLDEASDLVTRLVEALEGILEQVRSAESPTVNVQMPEMLGAPAVEDPRIEALETKIHDLVLAVSEGIQRVTRSENRVRAIVQGARRELAEHGFEHAGVEAEAGELRERDGDPSNEEELHAVPPDVGNGDDAPSPIPGVTVGEMRNAWRLVH